MSSLQHNQQTVNSNSVICFASSADLGEGFSIAIGSTQEVYTCMYYFTIIICVYVYVYIC